MDLKRALSIVLFFLFLCGFHAATSGGVSLDMDDEAALFGLPVLLAGEETVNNDVCPRGTRVVGIFMAAWQNRDYRTMYDMLDDKSKEDYPFDSAKFDFQFMEFKEYTISSIIRKGKNFEFILTSGNWRDGDKDLRKMLLDSETFKIVTPRKGVIFKESAER